jgi:hypothetical protein
LEALFDSVFSEHRFSLSTHRTRPHAVYDVSRLGIACAIAAARRIRQTALYTLSKILVCH